ncbi:unnamed protein product [Pleuronectes platessa]|uniref:Uncharacterized protein n=1 Tax=Pleuronectes platessa TaxID=8262 RepID=A0A9N7Z7K4_PLEPL|nr:unnamed protein product [Pleuronectes platessa]
MESHVRRLSVVVAVQNVLVVASLLVTVCVYWRAEEQQRVSGDNVHIQFDPISRLQGNRTLQFDRTRSKHMMSLVDEQNQRILVNCTGPYVLYVDVCYQNLNLGNSTGFLQLLVEGSNTPVSSFTLQASREVCRGLHCIVFLRAKERASLHLLADEGFQIKNATVGLNYLLGTETQCYF